MKLSNKNTVFFVCSRIFLVILAFFQLIKASQTEWCMAPRGLKLNASLKFSILYSKIQEVMYEGKSKSLCPYVISGKIRYIQPTKHVDIISCTFHYFST